MPHLLYTQAKSYWYPLRNRLGYKEKKSLPCQKSNPGHLDHSLVTILTVLFQFG
jgi:hypothetical protein